MTPSARNLADCRKFGMKKGGGTIRGKEWLCKGDTRAPLIWGEGDVNVLNGELTVFGTGGCFNSGEWDSVPTGIVAVFSVRICLGIPAALEAGVDAGLLAGGGTGHLVGAEVGPASVFTITLVLGVGFSAGFSGVLAGFSVFVDSFSGDADFLSDLITFDFSGASGFTSFSDFTFLSVLASDFSTRASVL